MMVTKYYKVHFMVDNSLDHGIIVITLLKREEAVFKIFQFDSGRFFKISRFRKSSLGIVSTTF